MTAAPTNLFVGVYCGHASMQQPHVMHRDSGYRSSCNSCEIGGPDPKSYVPSTGTHAFTRFRSSKMRCRSTKRSRTSGYFVIGSSVIGTPGPPSLSTSAEQDCLVLPLINIVQAP